MHKLNLYIKYPLLFFSIIFFCCSEKKDVVSSNKDNELVEIIYNYLIVSEYISGQPDSLGTNLINYVQNIDSVKAWLDNEFEDSTRTPEQWNRIIQRVNIKIKTTNATGAQKDTIDISKLPKVK